MSKRIYDIVTWTNPDKTAVAVKYTDELGPNKKSTTQGTVQKYIDDELNPTFTKILEQWPEEKIDEATEELKIERQKRLELDEKRKKEELEYSKIRKLFETKIEIFNIDEISKSNNREAKSKIRRSKSSIEAIINAVFLLMEEKNNVDTGDTEE